MVVGADAKAAEFKGFMSQDLRLPKYEAPKTERPAMVDEMYSVSWPHGNSSHFEHRVDRVLGSATLFAPLSHEGEEQTQILLERPVTPINEEIKAPPTSFNQLVKYVRRRIAAKRDAPYLSVEDQQNLAGILMGEVNGIWREVKKQVDDPFLSPEENRELNRRISVYIVTVCERLFKHYLHKAVVLNSRGVFTGPANMSRLKAQLALDANRLLNVLTVRRYIVSDIRGQGQRENLQSEITPNSSSLSFNSLMQSIRPTTGIKRHRYKTPIEEVEEISDSMPELDTTKLMRLLEGLPGPLSHRTLTDGQGSAGSGGSELEFSASVILEQLSRKLVLSKRSESLPLLRGFGETLLEELDIIKETSKPDVTYNITELLTGTKHDPAVLKTKTDEAEDEGLTPGESDLRQLVERSSEIDKKYQTENDQEDLPSLLQAMTRSRKHDNLRQRLDRQMEQLEKTQREDEERERITIQELSHPQPATVTSKLNNQMPVQTSDIRVSERVCMSSVTLQSYDTVYNDLQDEVSGAMIQQLDKNLYLEDEIKEVYKEVMKSVPTEHLKLEQDDLVMPSADHVDLSALMPSATLSRRKGSRLINPALETPIDAPWGILGPKDWVKTPLSPPKNPRGEDQFPPVTPNMEKIADILKAKNNGFQLNENMPPAVAEKMARTYASWFQWWKNTVSIDDYLKYVSTQDTDFLGVSYHFYDDEEEEGLEEPTPTPGANLHRLMGSRGPKRLSKDGQPLGATIATPSQILSMEKEKKLEEMKAQKSEFTEGFWNVNSVMMGGLGKDPEIEDKEVKTQRDTPDSDSSRRAKQTLKARAQARQSAKSRSRGEGGGRRPSEGGGRRPSTVASPITESPVSQSARSSPATEKPSTPQERLERVWNALHMPDSHRLDMAIKYSCHQYYKTLRPAMEKWEQVTELILQREAVLAGLEKFERSASDPNRFFVKGHKGSSAARLDEARERSYFYGRIEDLEDDIKLELDYIKNNFNDVVTFRGRPYVEKMKWDRIEMLYWLGEERKHNAIKYESMLRQIPLKTTHLDPILLESRG